MTTQIPFLGIMDLDSSNETIQKGYHKYARNIMFKGNRAENIKGTRNIAYTLPAGTNECIGSYYYPSKQKIIWFNWNSNNNHGIYQMVNGTIAAITVCAGTDYLNFTKSPIHSVNIIATDNGDLMKFVDSLKRPSQINIDRAIAGGYGTIERSFLDVAKEPPAAPPIVAYANDGTATVNNLTKSLFQFAYSYVFDDKEESSVSYFSELPIPPNFLDPNPLVTTNAKITVQVKTGKSNVKKIRIYARQNIENVYGDFYVYQTLDKSVLSITDNSTYTWDFKNNTVGIPVDQKYIVHLYDYVPKEVNSQELLNGDVVVYGGIKEGYNNDFTIDVSMTIDTTPSPFDSTTIGQVYNYWSRYSLGLIYFDDKGRTNGIVHNSSFDITTPAYSETTGTPNIPRINASVNHRPPVWATSFAWARTKNLSVGKFIYWVSDSTYKDDKFAYIGIQNLFTKLPGDQTKSILTYDFAPGDRIKFILLSGSATVIGKDYPIEELVNSPEINYIQRTGFFVKIKLPTTGAGFDFGASGFGSYLIELYSPASVISDNLNSFYEFGEVYQVGNVGLTNRFHKGGTQDQTANLSQPATFSFTKGDVYLKPRDITTGSGAEYNIHSGDAWKGLLLLGCTLHSVNSTNDTYILGSTSFHDPSPDTVVYTADAYWIIKTVGDAYTFRVKGVIKVNSAANITYRVWATYNSGTSGSPVLHEFDIIPNYSLVSGDNTISFDVTIPVPINTKVFFVTDNSADQALHYYETEFTITAGTIYSKKVLDPNFSDSFLSSVNSNGRPFVVDESLAETYKDILRFSEAYQSGTNINNTNRFYDLNYVDVDKTKGSIQRLKNRGDVLRVFQNNGVLPFGIYKQMLTNADGSDNLIKSEKILNRLSYYNGDFGIGNQPTSLSSSASADYFTDPIHGQIRLAGDGMTPISKLYRAQYYLPPIVQNYLQSYNTDSGSASKIIGVFDHYNEEFISIFQKCKSGSTVIYAGDTLAFNEKKNGYTTFYDYPFEWMMCADNVLVSWKNGGIYVHDSTTYNNFQGTAYPSLIDLVVNENPNVKKEYVATGYHSKQEWTYPQIITETGNQSNLIAADFEQREGMYSAAFLRDINSPGGLNDGENLVGVWMQFRIQNSSSALQFVAGLYVNYLVNTKNF